MPGSRTSKSGAVPQPAGDSRLRFDSCELSRTTRGLWRLGQAQPIRRKAYDVLMLLIDHRPQTLSHKRIAREIWGNETRAAKQVARAVMEARVAIGDDPEAPRCIVSVRGVGYRFASEVTVGAIQLESEHDVAEDCSTLAARDDIAAATACVRRAEFEEARRLVERAIATADLAGARPELACALALAATILLRLGSQEQALTLATKAMRMAHLAGSGEVLAQAQVGMAEVQLWMGSAHAALDHLQAAHAVLCARGPSPVLWQCERLLGDAYQQIGRPDDAWPWCERAEALALQLEPGSRAIRERLQKVTLFNIQIDAATLEGRDADAHTLALKRLELLDSIEPDARAVGSRPLEATYRNYRARALEFLGRVEEAWSVVEQQRALLFGPDLEPTQLLEFRRLELRQIEASLLSRSGRAVEAIEAVEGCVAHASRLAAWPLGLAFVQGLAARIHERAGHAKEALEWTRQQLRTTIKVHSDRAQTTADVVRAQMESDRLGEDLARSHAEIERLQQLNQHLERRILQMGRHPLLDEGGLVPAAALCATVEGRASLARERELPLCVGIVESLRSDDEQGTGAGLAWRRRLKLLSDTLKAVIPEASAPARWRPGLYFFMIPDMGLGPARRRCQALAHQMNSEMVPTTEPDPVVGFRADAVDITRFEGVEAALGHLPSVSRQLPSEAGRPPLDPGCQEVGEVRRGR